ncbi:MAG: hypothetical protein ABSG76_06175 [Xanthobacteraceae bacterium]|jgi:hypothetical protein
MAFVVVAELAAAEAAEQEAFRGLFRLHDSESYHDALAAWIGAAERMCRLSTARPNGTAGPI